MPALCSPFPNLSRAAASGARRELSCSRNGRLAINIVLN